MPCAVAIYIPHGTWDFPQAYFHCTACVGYVLCPKDNQGAMACASFCIPGALYQKALAVGCFYCFVSRKNLGACAYAVADNADCPVFRVNFKRFVHLMVHICDHQANGMPHSRADKFCQVAGRRSRCGSFFRAFPSWRSHGAQPFHNFFHDVVVQFIHVFSLQYYFP